LPANTVGCDADLVSFVHGLDFKSARSPASKEREGWALDTYSDATITYLVRRDATGAVNQVTVDDEETVQPAGSKEARDTAASARMLKLVAATLVLPDAEQRTDIATWLMATVPAGGQFQKDFGSIRVAGMAGAERQPDGLAKVSVLFKLMPVPIEGAADLAAEAAERKWAEDNAIKRVRAKGAVGKASATVVDAVDAPKGRVFVVQVSYGSRVNYCVTLRKNSKDGKATFNSAYSILNCGSLTGIKKWNAPLYR